MSAEWQGLLEKRHGTRAAKIKYAEAFEITEYGHQPSEKEIRMLFTFFPDGGAWPVSCSLGPN